LSALDAIVGDGDCGETFARGAAEVTKNADSFPVDVPHQLCLGKTLRCWFFCAVCCFWSFTATPFCMPFFLFT
jgi:hypothetical protein